MNAAAFDDRRPEFQPVICDLPNPLDPEDSPDVSLRIYGRGEIWSEKASDNLDPWRC